MVKTVGVWGSFGTECEKDYTHLHTLGVGLVFIEHLLQPKYLSILELYKSHNLVLGISSNQWHFLEDRRPAFGYISCQLFRIAMAVVII